MIASLPRGTFAPYTDAGTKIVYLTDKGVEKTKWFYDVKLEDSDKNSIALDGFQFFYQEQEDPLSNLPTGVEVVKVTDSIKSSSFSFKRPWKIDKGIPTVPLSEVAIILNGTPITEKDTTPGQYQVIAGGRGTVPYTHNDFNAAGNCFTISKSGAYSGYVWWHQQPIWSSDSLIVRSRAENEYLSFYLYLCMKTKQDEIYDRQQGTGQPHIYSEHVEDFPIPRISIEEQKAYTTKAYEYLVTAMKANEDATLHIATAVNDLLEKYQGS